jgi:transcriptional regulator of heat shock response
MPELTERQKTLLLLIVRDYIESESAQPVGSKRLAGITISIFPQQPSATRWRR